MHFEVSDADAKPVIAPDKARRQKVERVLARRVVATLLKHASADGTVWSVENGIKYGITCCVNILAGYFKDRIIIRNKTVCLVQNTA